MNIGWHSNKPMDKKQEWERKALHRHYVRVSIFVFSIPLIFGIFIFIIGGPVNTLALLRLIGVILIVIIVGLVASISISMIFYSDKYRIQELFFDMDHVKFKLNNGKVFDVKYDEITSVNPYFISGAFLSAKRDPNREAFIVRFIPKPTKEYPLGIVNRQIAKMLIDKLRELKILP